MSSFGERVKEARIEKGFTQEAFAKKLGLKQGTISDIERGKTKNSPVTWKMAELCGVHSEWLQTGKGEKYSNIQNQSQSKDLITEIQTIKIHEGSSAPDTYTVLNQTLESVNLKPEDARILQTDSLNMSPTIGKNSQVLIDTSDTTPKEGGIYLIQDGKHLALKRLIYEYSYLVMDSVWMMKNDNPNKQEYPDKVLPQPGNAKIIGRVVWYDNRI